MGLEPGRNFAFEKLAPHVRRGLEQAPAAALKLMKWKTPTLARVVNGWSMNTDTMGVYGDYYLKRAIVTMVGLGANQPVDAIYPMNILDADEQPLVGDKKYVLHFTKEDLPPVNAFWSVTLYDQQGYQVPNDLNRFAVSSWMPFVRNADGSLDLYVQHASPGAARQANWLPAPAAGPMNIVMRLYAPQAAALDGRWNPPAVKWAP